MICTPSHDKRKLELDVDDHLQCQYFHHKYLTNRCKKNKKKLCYTFMKKLLDNGRYSKDINCAELMRNACAYGSPYSAGIIFVYMVKFTCIITQMSLQKE